MKRQIIKIDEEKCTGCGDCIVNCPEGALQLIDGKARLVSEVACDGLGACIGHCPFGAINVEEREAPPYDERIVVAEIAAKGPNVLKAHLLHLKEHGQSQYLSEALAWLRENGIGAPDLDTAAANHGKSCACPGAAPRDLSREAPHAVPTDEIPSALSHWPVQLHLISPTAAYFRKADLLVAADCTAFAVGNFHGSWLTGKKLVIACPKLDHGLDIYEEKLTALIDQAGINTITVMIMEVPCCGGLSRLVQKASAMADRKVPIKEVVVGVGGDILRERWL
ncbi:MAG: 4Fe-4S dicluster domain-containing protein [Syntrophaceae bacterium]|nr:4Fe-4S dicluster domain-containing protein [Syntrophaceae bacterium]